MSINITRSEAVVCRTVASFLRKDALTYEADDLVLAAEDGGGGGGITRVRAEGPADGNQRNVSSGGIDASGTGEPTPTVLFRTIATNASVFCFAGVSCILLLLSLVSDRWIEVHGERETFPSFSSQGLRYNCTGPNCSPIRFDTMSICGRSGSSVQQRYHGVLILIALGFGLLCLVGISGAFLTKRFTDLRSILKVLRYAPHYFLEPAMSYHTEHPFLYRNRHFESVAIDENTGIQKASSYGKPSQRGGQRGGRGSYASEAGSSRRGGGGGVGEGSTQGAELVDMGNGGRGIFHDLWVSDTDDERSKSGAAFRPPEVQQRRSLKRKELKIRLASQRIDGIHESVRSAILVALFQLAAGWLAWIFIVAGTALYHSTADGWLNCGKTICDVVVDGSCAYGTGFATAITGTLCASFCVFCGVLASAFGLADLYACLSATMELSRLHEGQIRVVQQAALEAMVGRSVAPSSAELS